MTDAGTAISSGSGAVDLTGDGGSGLSQGYNYGVLLANSALVKSTDSATITITGTGSYGGTAQQINVGVDIAGASVISDNGDIDITGTGGGNGNGNRGFQATGGAEIESTGAANINITGIGAGGPVLSSQTGNNRHGIDITNTSIISDGTGSITMTGATGATDSGGTGPGNRYGWSVNAGSLVASYGTGAINLYASSMNISATGLVFDAGDNTLTLAPSQDPAGKVVSTLNLGMFTASTGAQNLSLTAANLACFSAGTFQIGSGHHRHHPQRQHLTRGPKHRPDGGGRGGHDRFQCRRFAQCRRRQRHVDDQQRQHHRRRQRDHRSHCQ